jgi:hypothetical protein
MQHSKKSIAETVSTIVKEKPCFDAPPPKKTGGKAPFVNPANRVLPLNRKKQSYE